MASIMWITIGITVAYGIVFGAFLAISFAIRREDKVGTLAGRAPNRACQSARHVAGFTGSAGTRLARSPVSRPPDKR